MMWVEWLHEVWVKVHAGLFPDFGVWTYMLLAALVATEGPLSTLVGAAAAAAGILDVRLVFVATVAGNIGGDVLWYSVGYTGKVESLLRRVPWLGSKRRHIARLKREMHVHATTLLVFAKLAYGLIVPTLVAAGMARVPWRRWLPVVFVMETLWSTFLVWAGFHATGWVRQFEQGMSVVGLIALGVAVGIGFWWIRRRIDHREIELDPLAQLEVYPTPAQDDTGWERLLEADALEPSGRIQARPRRVIVAPSKMARVTAPERLYGRRVWSGRSAGAGQSGERAGRMRDTPMAEIGHDDAQYGGRGEGGGIDTDIRMVARMEQPRFFLD
jgi:membrane protein DedA with SNARE-associated domain